MVIRTVTQSFPYVAMVLARLVVPGVIPRWSCCSVLDSADKTSAVHFITPSDPVFWLGKARGVISTLRFWELNRSGPKRYRSTINCKRVYFVIGSLVWKTSAVFLNQWSNATAMMIHIIQAIGVPDPTPSAWKSLARCASSEMPLTKRTTSKSIQSARESW